MIPKIIHYCWLSNDPYPIQVQKCIDSWKQILPDYKIMLWNFNRFNRESSIWVQEAFQKKKYAFAADFIRLYAVYNYGGFYLDSDVEVLKSFNDLLHLKTAICWQDEKDGFEAACFGAEKESHWLKVCLDYYQNKHFILPNGNIDIKPLPRIMEDCLKNANYTINSVDSIEQIANSSLEKSIEVLPSFYFSPKSCKTGAINKNKQTYSIHHFTASWVNPYDNLPLIAKIWKFLHLPDTKIRERFFGKKGP